MLEIYFTENDGVYGKLNGYLLKHIPPPAEILKTKNGKPFLEGDPVYFSLSHSKDRALIAICDKPVGADMEVIADRNYGATLSRFSEKERGEIAGLEDFLKHWVVREAYIKMTGSTLIKKIGKLSYTDGVLYDGGKAVDCEFINGSENGCVYCVCIDKRKDTVSI